MKSWTSLLMLSLALAGSAHSGEPDAVRQAELANLLVQDCGSCHGLQMRGGLGPALLPENLVDYPDEVLVATIIHGRHGTAMPAWRALLSEDDARWMVRNLRTGLAR